MRLGLIVVSLLPALVSYGGQSTEQIKLVFKPGEVLRYRTTMDMSMSMQGMDMKSKLTTIQESVVGKSAGGWTEIETTTKDVKVEGDDPTGSASSAEGFKGLKYKMKVDSTGATKDFEVTDSGNLDPNTKEMFMNSIKSDMAAGFMGLVFPNKPISEGSTWEKKIPAEAMFGSGGQVKADGGEISLTFTLLGFENINGKKNLKIQTIMDGNVDLTVSSPAGDVSGTTTMKYKITSYIQADNGHLTKSNGTGESNSDFGVMTMGQKMTMAIERID